MLKNFFIVILLILNILFLINYKQILNQSSSNKLIQDILCYDYQKIIKTDSSRLMSSNINVLNNNDQYIKLEDIIKNKPKLIIRYTSLTCNSCVDTLITYAKKVVKRIGRENVIVFAQYESLRDFHLFNRINKNYIDIYRVEDKITKLDYSDTPYMFILNPDKSISHLYIPHKEVPHLISWYFNQVEPILN